MAHPIRLAVLCSLFLPVTAFAGVDLNAFQANAVQKAGYLTPPSAPSSPTRPTSAVPPPLPSAVPGADATGFSSAPTPPAVPITNTHRALPPQNSATPLPPPLPSSVVADNQAASRSIPSSTYIPSTPAKLPDMSIAAIRKYSKIPTTHQIYLSADSTKNIALNVSAYAPNILVTPFHHAAAASSMIAVKHGLFSRSSVGRRLIFSLAPHYPVGIVVTGRSSSDPEFTMTMIPKNIPGQVYVLHITHWQPTPPVSAQVSTSKRVHGLTDIMVALANHKIPEGFSRTNRLPAVRYWDGTKMTPYLRYVGIRYSVTAYRVHNLSGQILSLNPSQLYRPGVLAVSFYPDNRLYGHGTTTLFLITHRSPKQGNFIGFIGRGS